MIFLDCTCSSFINENGYGNCKKLWKEKQVCFVNTPSNCADRFNSTAYPEKQLSEEACLGELFVHYNFLKKKDLSIISK